MRSSSSRTRTLDTLTSWFGAQHFHAVAVYHSSKKGQPVALGIETEEAYRHGLLGMMTVGAELPYTARGFPGSDHYRCVGIFLTLEEAKTAMGL